MYTRFWREVLLRSLHEVGLELWEIHDLHKIYTSSHLATCWTSNVALETSGYASKYAVTGIWSLTSDNNERLALVWETSPPFNVYSESMMMKSAFDGQSCHSLAKVLAWDNFCADPDIIFSQVQSRKEKKKKVTSNPRFYLLERCRAR